MIASSSREQLLSRVKLVSAHQDYAEYFTPARGSGKGEQAAIRQLLGIILHSA